MLLPPIYETLAQYTCYVIINKTIWPHVLST